MTSSPRDDGTQRELIEYRFNELFKRLDRIENTMQAFAFTKQSDHDKLVMKVDKLEDKLANEYVSKESIKPWQAILVGVAVSVISLLIIAGIKIVGDSL
jgi:hypothetical protein